MKSNPPGLAELVDAFSDLSRHRAEHDVDGRCSVGSQCSLDDRQPGWLLVPVADPDDQHIGRQPFVGRLGGIDEPVLHVGLGPESSFSGMMAKVVMFTLEAAGLPFVEGGSDRIVGAFTRIIEGGGGAVLCDCDVAHIDVSGGRATAVRTTDGRRMVMNMRDTPVALRRSPKAESHTTALLAVRSLAALDRCKNGWCRVKADGESGWAPAWALWGASDAPQCR